MNVVSWWRKSPKKVCERGRASERAPPRFVPARMDRQSLGMARLVSAVARPLASLRGNVSISSPTLSLSLRLCLLSLFLSRSLFSLPHRRSERGILGLGWSGPQRDARARSLTLDGRQRQRGKNDRASEQTTFLLPLRRPSNHPTIPDGGFAAVARRRASRPLPILPPLRRTARALTSPSQPTQHGTAGLTVAAMPMRWRRRRRRRHAILPRSRARRRRLFGLAKLVFPSSSHILPSARPLTLSLSPSLVPPQDSVVGVRESERASETAAAPQPTRPSRR